MSSSDKSSGPGRNGKPVVRVQRRRPSGPTASGRERAEAPRREGRTDQSTGSPFSRTTSSQTPSGQSWQRPPTIGRGISAASPRRLMLMLGLLALLFICIVGIMLLQSGGEEEGSAYTPSDLDQSLPVIPTLDQQDMTATAAPPPNDTPAPTAVPFVAPAGSSTGQSWLVMLYQDADDKILEKDIYVDLNEAERVGSTDNVHIVAQLDRYAGGYAADGNWTSTKRFYVTRDNDLERVGSQLIADIGEQNMADGETLVDFVTWAAETFPADKLVLILSDHGMGWPGGWSDPSPAVRGDSTTPLSAAVGNQLYLNELDAALQTIRDRIGLDKFEMIGMDACLMGQLEVFTMLEPHARYAVASEETEPALGWAYASFLGALAQNPAMTGADLSKLVVDSYIREDQRIVDDEARADLLRQGSPMGGLLGYEAPSSAQVASQMGRNVTLSAVDLSAIPALSASVNSLCTALQGADQRSAAQARNYAQSFTNIFGQQVPPAYIDLGHFVQLLQKANTSASVSQAGENVLAALQKTVIAEKHGAGKPGATGVAIYFPNSLLFKTPATGPTSYTAIASRFVNHSLWDDYLAYHYTGRAFKATDQQAAVPASSAAVTAPGQGKMQISAIKTSGKYAAPGNPILLSADINAQNLGHVMLFAGYYDRASNSLYVADMDYLESSDTREVDGVYYPVWPQGEFTLEFEWEPIVYYISNGETSVPALLTPASYGATAEEAVYTVDGVYTFATGESRNARLYFQDGILRQVFGFTGSSSASAPREIHPQTGDSFTVADRWLDLDAQGRVVNRVTQEGGTLTFGDEMFTWVELDAAAGEYVVGLIAVDLDGNRQEAYTQIKVQ